WPREGLKRVPEGEEMNVADNSGRIPTKKRGRPKQELSKRREMAKALGSRNAADMASAVLAGLDPELREELLPLAGGKKTTSTILGYVARFPLEKQRAMFNKLNRLGARAAKRYVECLTRPPAPRGSARCWWAGFGGSSPRSPWIGY